VRVSPGHFLAKLSSGVVDASARKGNAPGRWASGSLTQHRRARSGTRPLLALNAGMFLIREPKYAEKTLILRQLCKGLQSQSHTGITLQSSLGRSNASWREVQETESAIYAAICRIFGQLALCMRVSALIVKRPPAKNVAALWPCGVMTALRAHRTLSQPCARPTREGG